MNKCQYCESNLPERGFYCPNCSKQVRCKSCNDYLEVNANNCIMCGEDVGSKNTITNPNMNSVEFSESRSGRTFKATFTDTVGSNISDTLGLLLANKVVSKTNRNISHQHDEEVQDIEYNEEVESKTLPSNPVINDLNKIFRKEGEKIVLTDPRLKAKSKRDFGIRLTCLYMYYKKLLGYDTVSRNELSVIAKQTSVEDGNYRHWIVKENTLIRSNEDEVELLLPGIEFAKEILIEIASPEVTEKWKLGTKAKVGRKGKSKNIKETTENEP